MSKETKLVRTRARIPKDKVILFNRAFVYYLKDGKVFRARKKRTTNSSAMACKESCLRPIIWVDTIEEITEISLPAIHPTAKALAPYGVLTDCYKGGKYHGRHRKIKSKNA